MALLNLDGMVWFRRPVHPSAAGFTLVELLMVVGLLSVLAGLAIPLTGNALESMRLNASARDVERELQTARLKAVATKRPMRVRFNCPAAGQFRMVELIGTTAAPATADSASDRCSPTRYPYPSASRNVLVRPNNDGPVQLLQSGAAFGTDAQSVEFWPDGSVHASLSGSNPWPVIPSTGLTVTVSRKGATKSITVNGVGKIRIQ